MGMLFLVDDDMGSPIADVLRGLDHRVLLACDILGIGAKDPVICAHAEDIGAIVVTRNVKDYLPHLQRRQAPPRQFRRAGLLGIVNMKHAQASDRVRRFDPLVRLECAQVANALDCRIVLEIHRERVIVHR